MKKNFDFQTLHKYIGMKSRLILFFVVVFSTMGYGQADSKCWTKASDTLAPLLIGEDCSGPCTGKGKYRPDFFLETPIRTARVVLHVIQKSDGTANFQDTAPDKLYLQNIFDEVNSRFSNIEIMTDDGSTPPVSHLDTRIRFNLEEIRFHQNTNFWHSSNYYEHADIEMKYEYIDQVNDPNPNIYHVFLTGCRLGAGGQQVYIIGAGSFQPNDYRHTILMTAWYKHYENSGSIDIPVRYMAHELTHGLWQTGVHYGGPSGNLMSSGISGFKLTIDQIAEMNFFLEGLGGQIFVANGTDYCQKDESHDIIIANGELEEWCVNKKLNTDIIIQSGGELRISCEMGMASDAFIYVERGGRLILDGEDAKITHNKTKWFACATNDVEARWQGIIVEGNKHVAQSAQMQDENYTPQVNDPGIVLLKNGATLEYAYLAIRDGSDKPWPQNPHYWGGFVYAEDANFINNRWGVSFMKYDKTSHSAFVNCHFEATASAEPAVAIRNWAQKNILVDGCTFEGVGNGILSLDGVMEINNSNFFNLEGKGVWLFGTSPLSSYYSIFSDQAGYNFKKTVHPIYSEGARLKVKGNNMRIGSKMITVIGNSLYDIIDNKVVIGHTGIDLVSTGDIPGNRVFCNYAASLSTGLSIAGDNSSLKFNGNTFDIHGQSSTGFDVGLYADGDGIWASVPDQGSSNKPATNLFTQYSSYGHILTKPDNDQNFSFEYYYPSSSPNDRAQPKCASNDPCGSIWQNFHSYEVEADWYNVCDVLKPGEPLPELTNWEIILKKVDGNEYAAADQLLANLGTKDGEKYRIGLKIKSGDYVNAKVLLDGYPSTNNRDDEFIATQKINIERLVADYEYHLSDMDKEILMKIASKEGENTGYARSLLYLLEGISFEPSLRDAMGNIIYGGNSHIEDEKTPKLLVSPNPSEGIVQVDWSDFKLIDKTATIEIRDRMGVLIFELQTTAGLHRQDIDLTSYTDGVYFYHLFIDGQKQDSGHIILSKN